MNYCGSACDFFMPTVCLTLRYVQACVHGNIFKHAISLTSIFAHTLSLNSGIAFPYLSLNLITLLSKLAVRFGSNYIKGQLNSFCKHLCFGRSQQNILKPRIILPILFFPSSVWECFLFTPLARALSLHNSVDDFGVVKCGQHTALSIRLLHLNRPRKVVKDLQSSISDFCYPSIPYEKLHHWPLALIHP